MRFYKSDKEKANCKIEITKKIQTVLLVLATLVFFYGFVVSNQAGKIRKLQNAAENIKVIVTEKTNESVVYSKFQCDFTCTVKNDSHDVTIDKVSGVFKIMDLNGNVLSYGNASFSGEFEPQKKYDFRLTWKMDKSESNKKVMESDFSNLRFSFEIEEITYNGYETYKVEK